MIVDFQEHIRAQVNRMADEHLAMQEAISDTPRSRIKEALDALDRHAAELSKLASRLYEDGCSNVQGSKVQGRI